MFARYIYSHPSTFNQPLLYLKFVSYRQHMVKLCFIMHSVILSILSDVLQLLTIKVFIDMLVLKSAFLFVFRLLLVLIYLFSCLPVAYLNILNISSLLICMVFMNVLLHGFSLVVLASVIYIYNFSESAGIRILLLWYRLETSLFLFRLLYLPHFKYYCHACQMVL